ncbi:hypothetical protein AAKU55_001721 [Oxalobacteraceae bacterium GrIS 1.11]
MQTDMNPQAAIALIDDWLAPRLDAGALDWFHAQLGRLGDDCGERHAWLALGHAPRKLGKADLALSQAEMARAVALYPGLDPGAWSVDQAARIAFILAGWDGDAACFAARLARLAEHADLSESIALYQGYALYPGGAALEPRAREAIRSSMRPLYLAMAHRNPYPMVSFEQAAWNQMVVKAFFLEAPLWPIQGLDQRANGELAAILVDLAQERRAAGRPLNPEAWRCIAPHADSRGYAALRRALDEGTGAERAAVAWSLHGVAGAEAARLLARCRELGLADGPASAEQWASISPYETN